MNSITNQIGNSISVIRAFLNLYLTDGTASKEEGMRKIDDVICTMASINKKLFTNFDRQMLNIGSLIRELSINLADKHGFDTRRISIEAEDIEKHVDLVLPFGVLLTVLISSTMERLKAPDSYIRIVLQNLDSLTEVSLSVNEENFFHGGCTANEFGNEGEIVKALVEQIGAECKADGRKKNTVIIELASEHGEAADHKNQARHDGPEQ